MKHAIEDLKERIRATADMAKEYPENECHELDLHAVIDAIKILEAYLHGEHQTRRRDYINKYMYVIRVIDKDTNELFWTEPYKTLEQANEEVEDMKENHFNPEFFSFEIKKEYT